MDSRELIKRPCMQSSYPSSGTWTYRREAATGPHLNVKSVKKINVGNCQSIVLACSVVTNVWQP
jgi:hypothetical protein